MGLDLYAGTLTRYHTGAWEPEAIALARQSGLNAEVVYQNAPSRLRGLTAPLVVQMWRWRLQRKYGHLITKGLHWSEASSTPHFVRKPDHDGQRALVLAAAYAVKPQLALPSQLPASNDLDEVYAAASKNYLESIIAVLECHLYLPSNENFLVVSPDAVGTKRFITSTANLARALATVNRAHWQADVAQIVEWDQRGPIADKSFTVEGGKIVSEQVVRTPASPLVHSAQFGLAVYSAALTFSGEHNVPILTDE